MGVSHKRTGLPCQDAQGYRLLPDGMLFIALADGAGSAVFSDAGAATAVDAALLALVDAWERGPIADDAPGGEEGVEMALPYRMESILREAFSVAREAVLRLADYDEETVTPRDYACTLTCAIAAPDCLAVGQVGDGAVVALTGPDQLVAVTRLQRGEYANETHFLIQEDALDQLSIEILDQSVSGLAVMSDGLIRLALRMPTQEPHLPFFQPLFRFAETIEDESDAAQQLAAFLDSERVNARTDDDKSLVLAVRVPQVRKKKSRNGKSSAEERPSQNGEDE
jgi:hypothetical protein